MRQASSQRKQNVFRVPNVQVGQETLTVSFKVVNKTRTIRCATRGRKPFRIEPDDGTFTAIQKGVDRVITGKTAKAVFAKAVETFWS